MVDKKPDIREIMADYDQAVAFFHNTPAEAWEAIGVGAALKVFAETYEQIEVYRDIIKKHKINPKTVKSYNDFLKLPLIDKYNYVQKHGFNEINSVKAGQNLYGVSLSSGTIDEPTIWPRYFEYEEFLPLVFDQFMRQYWQIDKKSSLCVNAYALGSWMAGFSVHSAVRPLTQKYQLTLTTPGADVDSIVYTIKKLAKYYDQVIIFSYSTFVRTVLDRLTNEGVNIRKLNLKLFLAGESHTVEWRQYVNKLCSGDPGDLTTIIDGYGITDTGLSGQGSALTNLIRDLAFKDSKLCREIFGRVDYVPALFQYNPGTYFIETHNGEIVITTKSTTPLVRYNVHDRGGVIRFREMEEILSKHDYSYRKIIRQKGLKEDIVSQLPFVYCLGRRDDTVIIAGANIYPEQIAPVVLDGKIKNIHSFKLATGTDAEQHQLFYVLLELKSGLSYSAKELKKMEKKYHDIILKRLMSVSSDYAVSFRADPVYSDLDIEIHHNGEGPFELDLTRTKPRLVAKNH